MERGGGLQGEFYLGSRSYASLDMDHTVAMPLTTAFREKAPRWSTPHVQGHPGPPNHPVGSLGVGTRTESFPALPSRAPQSEGIVTAWGSVNWGGQKYER